MGVKMKRGPGRPKTIMDMREYKAMKQREYRARKLSPPQPLSKSNPNTPERNDE